MTSFWPKGIEIKDNRSPMDILNAAKEEWEFITEGELTLEVRREDIVNGENCALLFAKHIPSGKSEELCEVVRCDSYPVYIKPKRGQPPISVSEIPSQFATHLSEFMNLSRVKSQIVNLLIAGEDDN
jgi:hypothetical protein